MTPRFPFAKQGDPRGAAVDIVRGLVKLLAEITADGYVFRTDLGCGPTRRPPRWRSRWTRRRIIMKAMGQNWERAAMIKARPCAGDPQTGEAVSRP